MSEIWFDQPEPKVGPALIPPAPPNTKPHAVEWQTFSVVFPSLNGRHNLKVEGSNLIIVSTSAN